MPNRRVFGPLLAVSAALVITACGAPEGRVERAAGRQFLSVGTAPPGGAFFPVGGALAEVLNEFRGESPWLVTAEATKGSQENIRRLARGELDLALSNAAITYFAVRGEEGWQAQPVQAVMTLAPNVALFITPAGSSIRSLDMMRGKRVVIGPAGAGFEFFVRPILAAHGLGWTDIEVLNATQTAAVDLLADGAAAAAFLGGAIPTASITQASASQDIYFIPYAPGAVAELVERYPFFEPATIPAGTYRGQSETFEGLNVGSMHLIARTDLDEELVYRVTRTIWENRERVVERHPAGRAINPKVAPRDTGTPFHPGAVRYYREIGIWPG